MSKSRETFGYRLRIARRSAGLTLEQVANRSGVSKQAISLYEADDREPRAGQIEKLAKACRVTVAHLFGEVLP